MLGVQDVLLGVGSETSDKQLKLLNLRARGSSEGSFSDWGLFSFMATGRAAKGRIEQQPRFWQFLAQRGGSNYVVSASGSCSWPQGAMRLQDFLDSH